MPHPDRSIFRASVLHRYLQSRQESVLPRFVSPKTFTYLWLLFGLIMSTSILACFAEVPLYASGLGVVIKGRDSQSNCNSVKLVALLPPENHASLRSGQSLLLQLNPAQALIPQSIRKVEPRIMSPDEVQQQFLLNAGAAQSITQPVAVAIVDPVELATSDLSACAYSGSVYKVQIEVGGRRGISLLPWLGQLFGE